MFTQFKRLLIGKPKRNRDLKNERISNFKALAILSSDALSSVAYGPEQILITLAVVGAIASWYTLPIACAVLVLLAALILSYRQVIYAYPKGGGAYMVSKTNLGEKWGLVAGGSLLVDYILTVAVSIGFWCRCVCSCISVTVSSQSINCMFTSTIYFNNEFTWIDRICYSIVLSSLFIHYRVNYYDCCRCMESCNWPS